MRKNNITTIIHKMPEFELEYFCKIIMEIYEDNLKLKEEASTDELPQNKISKAV